jgi:phosphoglycerate dehydrogenase-like enzyme
MNDHRPRVLVCDPISDAGIELLAPHCQVDVRPGLDEDALVEIIDDYEAVIVRSATRITGRVIAHGGRLKVIARAGAGLDAIDVAAAVEAGIEVVNSPDANTVAVAELTLGLMLALARNVPRADAAMKDGRWEKSKLMGSGLAGKTLGIVGFGRIGQEVATRANAFGMTVITNQHRPTPELYLEHDVEPVDLYDLLARSDYVTLHIPARPDTEGLIGVDELAAMKPTAQLINTSRGTVVDEQALLAALDSGMIAGAGLDVFAVEPAVDNPLASHPRVIATPHIGASTEDAQVTAAVEVCSKILSLLIEPEPVDVLPLRFVEVDKVMPHESVDHKRSGRLAERVREEGVLRNPPLVARVDDRYVVLDGATRSDALRQLGYRHTVVQDVAVDDGLALETWHHVVRDIDPDALVAVLDAVPRTSMEVVEANDAAMRAIEYGGLCSVTTVDGRAFVIHPEHGANRFDALAAVAEAYIDAATVSRNLERNVRALAGWYPDMVALVEYPQFTVEQVLLAAGSGRLLPAGVTRFLIPGRVLRLDIPLEMLADDRTLAEKNRWLQDYLREKERRGRIRYYREPVYLLDE